MITVGIVKFTEIELELKPSAHDIKRTRNAREHRTTRLCSTMLTTVTKYVVALLKCSHAQTA